IWGPISDMVGRKIPLYLGMLIFVIGTFGCAYSTSMTQLVTWRIIMALGACTAPMLARAMIRDQYSPTRVAEILLLLNIILAISPILGPLLGSAIAAYFSWHAIFIYLAIVGFMFLLISFTLPETLTPTNRVPTSWHNLAKVFTVYAQLLGNWQYMRYVLTITFLYIANYTFITGSPFVFITYFGASAVQFSLFFAAAVVGNVILSLIIRNYITKLDMHLVVKVCTLWATFWGIVLVIIAQTGFGGMYAIIMTNILHFAPTAVLSSLGTSLALAKVKNDQVGAATALLSALQYGSGIVSSTLLALIVTGTIMPYAVIILVFVSLSFLVVAKK
ncbi:MFS transporter, partial [Psittacicella gerlachiana]